MEEGEAAVTIRDTRYSGTSGETLIRVYPATYDDLCSSPYSTVHSWFQSVELNE